MPITITEKPFLFDFVHNAVSFTLNGTPTAVAGRNAVSRYQIISMPRVNYMIVLSYGTKTYNFFIRNFSSAQTNPFEIYSYSASSQIKKELERKIAQNYYINQDFEVTVSDSLEIIFTARQYGENKVMMQSNDNSANIMILSYTTGIAEVEKTGYKLFAKLEISQTISGAIQTVQTPEILLHVDANNRALLPLTLLRSFFSNVDIPVWNENFAAYPLQYALLKYRLIYTDYFDDLMQAMECSVWQYLVNGKMSETDRIQNLPEWNCPMSANSKLSSFARPRSYGSPSGLNIKSYPALSQYAYFMLFNNSGTESYKSSLEVRVDILNEDGTAVQNINPGTITLSNFSTVRIPLSVKSLSLHTYSMQILLYRVRIYHTSNSTAVWTRTYIMQQKPFHAKEFLLQNKYGILESFFIDNEMIEKKVEGEKIICAGKTEIDITDVSTIYTARTGYKSNTEMKLLSEAMENRFHYKRVNDALVRITILPNTFIVIDEAEDLQTAEFQYVFNMPENVPYETTDQTGSETLFVCYIWRDEEIWNDASHFITQ